MTPLEAAGILTAQRNQCSVDRMAISGGEPTLNRAWLIRFFQDLRRLNPDAQVCILDYFPAFRRLSMQRPTVNEMQKVRETLLEARLKTVLAQTTIGYIGS